MFANVVPRTSHGCSRDELNKAWRNHGAVATLRRATRDGHLRLEARLDVMAPDLTLARYRSLLLGVASLQQALDNEIGMQLSRVVSAGCLVDLDFDSRRKTPLLSLDLSRLGLALPTPVPFRLSSLAEALGALYVCEGATLGGSIIAPHILDVLGDETPVSFFASYGSAVPLMWSTCRLVINELLDSQPAVDIAASAAVRVFERFTDVLS